MSDNPLINTLIALSGQDEVIVIHRAFVEFTGSLEAAMMLNQLLYWTPRSRLVIDEQTGWIARSDEDWAAELMFSKYSVRLAREALEKLGIVATVLRRFDGAPRLHYRIQPEPLMHLWLDFAKTKSGLCENEKSTDTDFAKTQNGLCENAETCIETYIETYSIESQIEDRAASPASLPPSQPVLLAPDPDQTTAFNGELDALFQNALKVEAQADGKRGPQKWGSMAQKKQYRLAAQKIVDRKGVDELQRAITEGLKRERKSRDSLVAWISAWADNLDKPHRDSDKTANTAGQAFTREQARQWYGDRGNRDTDYQPVHTGGPSYTSEQARQWYGKKS